LERGVGLEQASERRCYSRWIVHAGPR
jgi:hypothetical protein